MEGRCPGAFWNLLPLSFPRTDCSCQLSIFLTDIKQTNKPLTLIPFFFVRAPLTISSRKKSVKLHFKTLYLIGMKKYLAWALPLQMSVGWSNTEVYEKWWSEVSIMSACRRWACNASEKYWKTRCSVIITAVLKLCSDYASDAHRELTASCNEWYCLQVESPADTFLSFIPTARLRERAPNHSLIIPSLLSGRLDSDCSINPANCMQDRKKKHLQKLSHISGGLNHPGVNLTAYHWQDRGEGLQVPNLIVYPNSVGLNVSREVKNVSALSHSLKSVGALLVNLAPQLLGMQPPYLCP